jgi:hypothetical protein
MGGARRREREKKDHNSQRLHFSPRSPVDFDRRVSIAVALQVSNTSATISS